MSDRGNGLRVALVLPGSEGGIGRHVRMLVDGLVARGDHVTVVAPPSTLCRFDFAAAGAGTVSVDGWVDVIRRAPELRRLAAAHDVVHAHGVRMGAAAGVLGLRPLVSTWHNAPLG